MLSPHSCAPPPLAPGAHPTVLEILEVPQLMDTCCRSGNFDEALDLCACVNKVREGTCRWNVQGKEVAGGDGAGDRCGSHA